MCGCCVQSECVLEMLHISVKCLVCFVLLTLLLVRCLELSVFAFQDVCILCMVVCVGITVCVKFFLHNVSVLHKLCCMCGSEFSLGLLLLDAC